MGKKSFKQPQLTVEELSIALSQSKTELQKTNEKLRQTEKNRSELFANISHDLRSPLTALKSTVEYMASMDTYDKAEMTHLIRVMSNRIQTLESLVNASYLLTTLENEAIPLQYKVLPIGSFLEEFFFNRLADAKYDERRLEIDIPEEFEYPVRIEPERFERVLDNLFTNALKYSKAGAEIVLKAWKQESKIMIQVRDTGMGIPAAALERIFDRAYQVEQSRTPGMNRGSGLGLAIVKLILDRHDAKISCESEVGTGSVFTIELPLCSSNNKEVNNE